MAASPDVNNPYTIEKELNGMIKEVNQYHVNQGVVNGSIIPVNVFKKQMEEKYNYLYKTSKGLFDKCLMNDFKDKRNLKRINEMIAHLKNIYNGKVSRDNVDRQLGAKYAREYVDPLVKNLDKNKK